MAMHIPGYRVIRKINQGGMSTVYLAIQISVGRVVALKVMSPQLNNDPAFSERFQREATIVGQLSHPNIVAIYDIGRHEDLNYIAMDYLPNGSVHDKMSLGLSGEEALRITKEIALALDHAHEKGYIHRDIKPENILFRADNSAVLSDFGVARGLANSSRMTHVGTVVGTPHYMSPEQTKGQHVDGRADLYSLGIVFYEMLTGTLPYQGDEAVTIALKHISAPLPKLPMQYLAYQRILDKLLDKNPDQRFQRGRDLAQAIDELSVTVRNPNMTLNQTTDLTVLNLFSALLAATRNAIRWRWNRLNKMRWSSERGFYVRPATKVTEIFFNEQHEQATPTLQSRALQETSIHNAFSRQPLSVKVLAFGLIALVGILGFYFLFSGNSSSSSIVKETPTSAQLNNVNTPPKGIEPQIAIATTTSKKTVENQDAAQGQVQTSEPAVTTALDGPVTGDTSTLIMTDEELSLGDITESNKVGENMEQRHKLRVETTPSDARVRILNISDRYQSDMELLAGSYQIEVSKEGFETLKQWIKMTDKDLKIAISLKESIASGTELSSNLTNGAKGKGPEMITIPAGSFYMGNKNDSLSMPVHQVSITRKFAISKYEITFDNYDTFAQATNRKRPDDNKWGRGNHPVINVTYSDALAYAQWLTKTTGKKYRLATESEWEYVARAGTLSYFWWGDDIKDGSGRANCRRGCNSKFSGLFGSKTAPVGSYAANGFGVYDTAGNVAEWVQDCFADNYRLHPKNGLAYEIKNCDARVVRGGSAKHNIQQLGSATRDYNHPEIYNEHLGFRVVMELN